MQILSGGPRYLILAIQKPEQLPSNTLLLTLSSGEIFQISPNSSNKPVVSRVPTPIGPGYSSDGEIEELRRQEDVPRIKDIEAKEEQEARAKSHRETRMKKSAMWEDLVKYAISNFATSF